MNKYVCFLGISLLLSFISCKDNNLIENTEDEETDFPISLPDDYFDVLGFGYDVTGRYMNMHSTRAKIMDISSLHDKDLITSSNLNDTSFTHCSGTDIVNFSYELSSGLGLNLPGFAGTFDYFFKNSYPFESKRTYAFYSINYLKKGIMINGSTQDMKANLATNFKNHLNNMSPAEIVETYGTHVLKSIYLGAKFEAYMETEATSTDKKAAAEAKLGNAFKQFFKTDVHYSFNGSLVKQTKNSTLFYKTNGGKYDLSTDGCINLDRNDINSSGFDISKWSKSVPYTTPQFITVEPNTLIPIYELIDDPDIKSSVENFILQYIEDAKPITVNNYSSDGE